MSTDLKNSILLWVGAVACAGLFWATARFDILPQIPPNVLPAIIGAALALEAIGFIRRLYRKRKARDH